MTPSTSLATSLATSLVVLVCPLLAVQPRGASWRPNPAVMELHPLGNLVEEVQVEEELESLWPDNAKSVEEMVGEAGYPVESHVVATTDGHLLTVHRIPRGRSDSQEEAGREERGLGCLVVCSFWTVFFRLWQVLPCGPATHVVPISA